MKKSIILFFLMSMPMMAQQAECVISGPSEVLEGGTYTYTVNANAQCDNCHDWDIVNPTALDIQIVDPGDDQESTVMVFSGSGPGSFTLQLTYFDETGCHTCTLDVVVEEEVVDPCEIDPEIQGKLFCDVPPSERHGEVSLDHSMDISMIESVTWIFDETQNNGNYSEFQFSNGSTSILSSNSASYFQEPFTFTGTCDSSYYICFDMIIKFNNGCPAAQYRVCDNLLNKNPLIIVSPNPAISDINISIENLKGENILLEIYDLNGKLLKAKDLFNIPGNNIVESLDLPKHTGNILVLKVILNEEVIDTKQIIVRN